MRGSNVFCIKSDFVTILNTEYKKNSKDDFFQHYGKITIFCFDMILCEKDNLREFTCV
jgi:hypothetical protein